MAKKTKRNTESITSKEVLDTIKRIAFSEENIERLEQSIVKLKDKDRVDFYSRLPKVFLEYEQAMFQRENKSADSLITSDDEFMSFVEGNGIGQPKSRTDESD
jgi:hypothetical protein